MAKRTNEPKPAIPAEQAPQWERAQYICDLLKISPTTLWHWVKHRTDFPRPVKAGPRVTLFNVSAINAWLASQQGATQ